MIKFGTGGWRAIIGDEFTKANVQILAQAVADKMITENKAKDGMVIGYDRRFLSKEAMQWAAAVFAANGIKVSLINKSAPTPLVMFYVMKHKLPYGMMVTASHNPAIYRTFVQTRQGTVIFTGELGKKTLGQRQNILAALSQWWKRQVDGIDAIV